MNFSFFVIIVVIIWHNKLICFFDFFTRLLIFELLILIFFCIITAAGTNLLLLRVREICLFVTYSINIEFWNLKNSGKWGRAIDIKSLLCIMQFFTKGFHALLSSSSIAATAAKDAKAWSLPSFGSHLNPISTRGGRLCLTYTGVLGWLKFAVDVAALRCIPKKG